MSHVAGNPERRYGIDTRASSLLSVRSLRINSPLTLLKKTLIRIIDLISFSVYVQSNRERGKKVKVSEIVFVESNFLFDDFLHNRKEAKRGSGLDHDGRGKNNEGLKKKLSCVNWASMTRWKTCHGCFDSPTILALSSFRGRSFRFPIASCKGKKKEVGMSRWSVIAMKLKR